MNHLIFFDQNIEKDEGHSIVDPSQIKHLRAIINVKVDAEYKAIRLGQGLCHATCLEINKEKIIFKLHSYSSGEERKYDLLIGLSRPQTIKKILEYCAGQPIRKIFFYKAELSEKSYSTSKIFEEGNLKKSLADGLSQCGRFHTFPQIEILKYFPEKLISQYSDKFTLSLEGQKSILDHPSIIKGHPLIAVGPERGFTDIELDRFHKLSFLDILLSKSILRVETAVIALCSQLELLTFQK
jgi:16S rRNA (uracil1498-N3)-methyltransferase